MSNGFTKLAAKIVNSSIWSESHPTRIVWVTMLAMSDAGGVVLASVGGLANAARVTDAEAKMALMCFLSPDKDSSDPDHEGRRIEVVTGGWRLLNYRKYRIDQRASRRREQNRIATAKWRQAHRESRDLAQEPQVPSPVLASETPPPPPPNARPKFTPPTIEEVKLACAKIGLPEGEAEKFVAYYTSNNWMVGKNKMAKWMAALTGWRSRWQERGGLQGGVSTLRAPMRDTSTPRDKPF